MDNIIHEDLLVEIGQHCTALGLTKSAFGERILGDPRLVFDLEKGRELRRATEAKIRRRMRDGVVAAHTNQHGCENPPSQAIGNALQPADAETVCPSPGSKRRGAA